MKMSALTHTEYSYNPKNQYSYNTAELVVKELQKQGYQARCSMGISQMKIQCNAPLMLVTDLVWDVWCRECE